MFWKLSSFFWSHMSEKWYSIALPDMTCVTLFFGNLFFIKPILSYRHTWKLSVFLVRMWYHMCDNFFQLSCFGNYLPFFGHTCPKKVQCCLTGYDMCYTFFWKPIFYKTDLVISSHMKIFWGYVSGLKWPHASIWRRQQKSFSK